MTNAVVMQPNPVKAITYRSTMKSAKELANEADTPKIRRAVAVPMIVYLRPYLKKKFVLLLNIQ